MCFICKFKYGCGPKSQHHRLFIQRRCEFECGKFSDIRLQNPSLFCRECLAKDKSNLRKDPVYHVLGTTAKHFLRALNAQSPNGGVILENEYFIRQASFLQNCHTGSNHHLDTSERRPPFTLQELWHRALREYETNIIFQLAKYMQRLYVSESAKDYPYAGQITTMLHDAYIVTLIANKESANINRLIDPKTDCGLVPGPDDIPTNEEGCATCEGLGGPYGTPCKECRCCYRGIVKYKERTGIVVGIVEPTVLPGKLKEVKNNYEYV